MNEYEYQQPQQQEPRVIISADALTKFFSIEDLLTRIEAYLKGQIIVKNAAGEEITTTLGKRIMNDEGIQEILQIMRKRLDGIVYSTSFLDLTYIQYEVFFFNLNLIELIAAKAKDWELDTSHYEELIDYLTSAYESILRKALGGQTLRIMFGLAMQPQQEKKGVFT